MGINEQIISVDGPDRFKGKQVNPLAFVLAVSDLDAVKQAFPDNLLADPFPDHQNYFFHKVSLSTFP
jgi:hypothetical protein